LISRDSDAQAKLREAVVALVLTFVAGFVDGFGFLTLNGMYVANMSGNSVQLGVYAVAGEARSALLHGFTIAMFLAGLLLSGAVIELAQRRGMRRVIAMAMALELLSLLPFLLLTPGAPGRPAPAGLMAAIAAAAVAMGLQNTSLRMANILTTYTTHVTGTITRFSEDLVAWLIGLAGSDRSGQRQLRRGALLSGGLWVAFVLGTILAAVLLPDLGRVALVVPLAIVLAAGATDAIAPIAPPESKEGDQRLR
jgi:uncharacterized membrane protein YoaK (UPF0700 family)